MQTRREFLQRLGIGAGLGAAAATLPAWARPAFALAPSPAFSPGIQLYTVRELLKKDFRGTLRALARIGYREVEFAGYFGHAPAAVRALLRELHLEAPASHVAWPANDEAWEHTLTEAAAAGHRWVVIPWLDEPLRNNPVEWFALARRLGWLGALARDHGLRLAYHNQAYDVAPVERQVLLDVLLEQTNPEYVDFELDTYWASRGGRAPVDLLRAHPDRFRMLHLKDVSGAADQHMADVGAGTIDFRTLLDVAAHAGVRHAFVEHDDPADALASARASYRYLARISR